MAYRFQVLAAKQQKGERFRRFYERTLALVDDADYTVPCRHAKEDRKGNQKCSADCPGVVDYGDAVLRDVLIAGIYDAEIKRMVLEMPGVHKMDSKGLVECMDFRGF